MEELIDSVNSQYQTILKDIENGNLHVAEGRLNMLKGFIVGIQMLDNAVKMIENNWGENIFDKWNEKTFVAEKRLLQARIDQPIIQGVDIAVKENSTVRRTNG